MRVASDADICRPPFGSFCNEGSRVLGERMERRQAIHENEKHQASSVRNKGEWKGSIGPGNDVGNREGKKCWDHKEEDDAWQRSARLKVTKDQVGRLFCCEKRDKVVLYIDLRNWCSGGWCQRRAQRGSQAYDAVANIG